MFSPDELNQPVAVGPVGQPFTPGPVGTHARVSDCKRMDQIDDDRYTGSGKTDRKSYSDRLYENRHNKRAGELGRHSPFE